MIKKIKILEVIPLRRFQRSLGVFDYSLPAQLADRIELGQLVTVPFRNSRIEAIVTKIKDQADSKYKLKPVSNIVNQAPIVNQAQIGCALELAKKYYVSPAMFLKLMVPKLKNRLTVRPPKQLKLSSLVKPTLLLYQQNPTKSFYKLIEKVLKKKQQVLILEPQLPDVEHLVQSLLPYYPNTLSIHKGLKEKDYFEAWQKIYSGEAKVIIGTRSALWCNYPNLGLIIVDQEHSIDYKQYDQNPRYHANEVALKLAQQHGAKAIFASYAPSVETYYLAQEENWQILQPEKKTKTKIIDLTDEHQRGNYSPLSEELQKVIAENLEQKKQTLLFLNRRGQATLTICQDCSHQLQCPDCQNLLTEHLDKNQLICHNCGRQQSNVTSCPVCQSTKLKALGLGTQKLETETKKLFPQSNVLRIDKDSQLKERTQIHQADIIIATQSIFHYPIPERLALISVVNFDQLLNIPSFLAEARAWQLLWQLASQYSQTKPELLVQSYNSENEILQHFQSGAIKDFYQQQLASRQKYQLPPFYTYYKIFNKTKDKNKLTKETENLTAKLKLFRPMIMELKTIKGQYYQVVFIKHKAGQILPSELLPTNWQIEINPDRIY